MGTIIRRETNTMLLITLHIQIGTELLTFSSPPAALFPDQQGLGVIVP